MPKGIYQRKKFNSTEEQFNNRIIKNEESGCWEYMNADHGKGYRKISIKGKKMYAHRYAYELYNGEIPEGMLILHSCDNRKCVNPDHLSLGTQKDNSDDMVNKGRSVKGSKHYYSKLTEQDVIEIKIALNSGIKQRNIAEEYKISESNISNIKNNRIWTHVNI